VLASFKACLQNSFQALATYKSYNISNEMQKCIVIEAQVLQPIWIAWQHDMVLETMDL
jgi:hypothetical protein